MTACRAARLRPATSITSCQLSKSQRRYRLWRTNLYRMPKSRITQDFRPWALVSGLERGHSNNRVRRVGTDGVITTVTGSLNFPVGVALDAFGDLYLTDTGSNRVRR